MLKRLIPFLMLVIIFMSLAGCSSKTIKFDTPEDMQAALLDEFYYFEFDSEMFCEAKEISVIEWKDTHNGNPLCRYSIWYDIVNHDIDQEYRLNIVGTHVRKPITITDQYIDTGNIIHNSVVIDIAEIEEYYYYFILKGSEHTPEESEVKYYKTKIQSIITTKYKLNR